MKGKRTEKKGGRRKKEKRYLEKEWKVKTGRRRGGRIGEVTRETEAEGEDTEH